MQPHQQQTVITSPAVIQPTYVSQPYVTASVAHSYRDHQSAVIGIVLIVTGSLSIGFNIVDIAVGAAQYNRYSSHHYYYTYSVSDDSNGVAGHGIWCGIMVVIAGGFAIGAARHKTRCMINTFLVFAIIGAVLAAIQVIVASAGANNVHRIYGTYFNMYDYAEVVFAMEILLAILGVAEFAFCLWGSVICCATGGCCAPSQPTVYVTPAQPQVTVITAQQPIQMQPKQPPNYQQTAVYPTSPQNPGYAPTAGYYTPGYEPTEL